MRPKRDPVPRARDAWVWLGGIALLGILGGGVTVAAIALWERIDIRQLMPGLAAEILEAPPSPRPPTPATLAGGTFDAVFLVSPRNEAYFPEQGYYAATLEAWRSLASGVGGTVREATSAEELRQADAGDVLLLIEAPCLSQDELAAVRAHLDAGGGVVANWAVGARDQNCGWVGWQVVQELTGSADVRELPDREALFFTIPQGSPLSLGIGPGARIELRSDRTLALRVEGPRVYWSDWALNPAPDEGGGGADAAAVAVRTPAGGRVAWFGFRPAQAVTASDSLGVRRMVENGIAWAAGVPAAAPSAWPDGEQAALMVALGVEDRPEHAAPLATTLRERGIPSTFYVVSQLVQDDDALAATLSAAGEVGTQTSDHTPLLGLTAQDQRFRLRRSSSDVSAWTGTPPAGLHPPEESFDANTLEAWQLAGGRYIVATNDGRSASPEIHATAEGSIVLLPRTIRDDYNLIVQERVVRASSLERALLDETRKVHAIGGLAIVSGHTQIMRPGPRPAALVAAVDSARAQGGWWLAQGQEVADWWLARDATRLTFVPQGAVGYLGDELEPAPLPDVLVQAPIDRGISGLWIDLALPRASESTSPLVNGNTVGFEATDWGMRVPMPVLAAGDTARISFVQATSATSDPR